MISEITENLLTLDKRTYNFLIRVFKEQSYAEAFIRGEIWLGKSTYYNNLDDKHRGDPYDSCMPVHSDGLYIRTVKDAKGIEKFVADEPRPTIKIEDLVVCNENSIQPVLCCSIIDKNVVEIINNRLTLKNDFYQALKKFGGEFSAYFVLIDYNELFLKFKRYMETTGIIAYAKKVQYVDIKKEYNSTKVLNKEYDSFMKEVFTKDNSYKQQNELRIILFREDLTSLFNANETHYIAQVGAFEKCTTGELDDLMRKGINLV